ARVLLLAVLYLALTKLGRMLAFPEGHLSPIWLPAGIALAALLLFGYRLWPGVALGSFLASVSAGRPFVAALPVGLGSGLGPLLGAYLLRRVVKFRNSLERPEDILGLMLLGAGLSTMVSATVGAGSLCLAGAFPWNDFSRVWWIWWVGDALGV